MPFRSESACSLSSRFHPVHNSLHCLLSIPSLLYPAIHLSHIASRGAKDERPQAGGKDFGRSSRRGG